MESALRIVKFHPATNMAEETNEEQIAITIIVVRLEMEIVIVNDNDDDDHDDDYKYYYLLPFKAYLAVLIYIPDVRLFFKTANLMLTLLLELPVYS